LLEAVQAHSFPKSERLRRRRDFIATSQTGTKVTGRYFIVISLQRPCGGVRIGITASRKVGGAVVRNRIKRLVRECYRLNKGWFASADYSVIARSSAVGIGLDAVCKDLSLVLQKLQAQHG
jgi:ribonuclease P protein component